MISLDKNEFYEQEKAKRLFTAGPSSLVPESIEHLSGCFGRNDDAYNEMKKTTLNRLLEISGQQRIAALQGSATLAIEIAVKNILAGDILIIQTGYYSERLKKICEAQLNKQDTKIDVISTNQIEQMEVGSYDWILACYTETSVGYKNDIEELKRLTRKSGAKLFLDATASIGLETDHGIADVVCFSSCKGLFAITGASFIAFKGNLSFNKVVPGYCNIETHLNGGVTGPYHQIQSLYGTLKLHEDLAECVRREKRSFIERYKNYLKYPERNQPYLCTGITKKLRYSEESIRYEPRGVEQMEVVCHIGGLNSGILNKQFSTDEFIDLEV